MAAESGLGAAGDVARDPMGVPEDGEPGGLFLNLSLGRPTREVSVSLPEPEPPAPERESLFLIASAGKC